MEQPTATFIAAITAAISSIIAVILNFIFNRLNNNKIEKLRSQLIKENSYLAEKGKNAATKEDLEEINRKLESIRSEYTTALEVLKWQLSKRTTLHRLQVEKEFEVYSQICDATTELKCATEELRPTTDYNSPNETEEEKWQRRWKHWHEKHNLLVIEIQKHRPFYSHEVYLSLTTLLHKSLMEK